MYRNLWTALLVMAPAFCCLGCGSADNSVKVSGVDDSVVQTEEQMKQMEEQYQADSGSR